VSSTDSYWNQFWHRGPAKLVYPFRQHADRNLHSAGMGTGIAGTERAGTESGEFQLFIIIITCSRRPACCQIWQRWFEHCHITLLFQPPSSSSKPVANAHLWAKLRQPRGFPTSPDSSGTIASLVDAENTPNTTTTTVVSSPPPWPSRAPKRRVTASNTNHLNVRYVDEKQEGRAGR
jgi:hypothetical protein